uniref:Uncharacterized protein n=1 Tax=Anguilla anguilla TaxID=7936 RepID=A0A0E9X419_ANGAN
MQSCFISSCKLIENIMDGFSVISSFEKINITRHYCCLHIKKFFVNKDFWHKKVLTIQKPDGTDV